MGIRIDAKTGINIIRRAKKFERMPIVPMYTRDNTRYFIFDKKDELIGAFNFGEDGALTKVRLDEKIKRTKKAGAALLSIRDFIIEKAQKNGIKQIYFSISATDKDRDNLRRLCGKFNVTEKKLFNGLLQYVGVLNPRSELETMSKASGNFTRTV